MTPKKPQSKPKYIAALTDAELMAKCSARALAKVRKARGGIKSLSDEDIKLVAQVATLAYQKLKSKPR